MIFLCDRIPENPNSVRFQRAAMLAANFETAIIHDRDLAGALTPRFARRHKTAGAWPGLVQKFLVICRLRIRHGYRILYSQYNSRSIMLAALAKRLFGMTWIYDLWDHPSLELAGRNQEPLVRLRRWATRRFVLPRIANADLWVVAMEPGILKHLPKSGKSTEILTVTNGVGDSVFAASEANRRGASKCEPSEDMPGITLVHSGFVTPERGVPQLLRLLQLELPFALSIVAFGPTDERSERMIEEHNSRSPDKLRYLGVLSHQDGLRHIAEADVGLCLLDLQVLNYNFAFPIKILEYLALGKMVLATDTPATRSLVRDGQTGFLVDNSIEEIVAALEQIAIWKRDGKLRQMGEMSRDSVRDFDWNSINGRILRGIREVLETAGEPVRSGRV